MLIDPINNFIYLVSKTDKDHQWHTSWIETYKYGLLYFNTVTA